jgi:CO/xanthine dehydrogenase FAD-binding subunit
VALHHVQTVTRPTTLEQAWREKTDRGKSARFVGGGIDVVLYAPPYVHTLIDLSGVALRGISKEDAGISIGAATTMTEAIESPELRRYADGFLVGVLKGVASPLQRNVATFGGTIASAHPWSDVIPALLVLDAELLVYDGTETRLGLEGLLAGRGKGEAPLICRIILPKELRDIRGAFETFTRTAFDVATLNVACAGRIGVGRWSDVRIAVGGRPGLGKRLRDIEEVLEGAEVSEASISGAAEAAADAIDAHDDVRASAAYRRTLAEVLVGRALRRIAEGADGGTV